ncbi:MAG: NTP transferase domain-containing protein [Bacteroidetes bacterium]|nr:NTP transferase domain-containing protein [Bacteroidota bacterium]MBU1678951.1 NTP transferase domain-containing protein [Bacteroidota bacterium]MBU2507406.1 NTP transferase domain-containing protein [Bacteroidota bacterium]
MRAIIPVAGFGTRLKPHTFSHPKVLLNVGGKPILGHIIERLLEENIDKATFIIGHLGEKIQEYVTKTFPKLKSEFVVQEEMLGLGHAIYTAMPTVNEEEVFIILGDTVFDVELKGVLTSKVTSLGVKYVEDPRRFGVAVTDEKIVTKLVEKPQEPVSQLALVGLYYIANADLLKECLNELIEKDIRTKGEYQLTDALQLMITKKEKITTFDVEGWYDCGKPETLLSTNKFLLERNGTNRRISNVVINDPVFISETASLKNCVVGPFTTIAENCRIENSIIKNSIIASNSNIKNAMLEDSIIGNNASIKGSFQRLNAGDSSEIEYL